MTVPLIEVVTRSFVSNKINLVVMSVQHFFLLFISKYFIESVTNFIVFFKKTNCLITVVVNER